MQADLEQRLSDCLRHGCLMASVWCSETTCSVRSGASHQPEVSLLQVKLLKCLVDNIVVDISFETLGGLCTVAFLESIDRNIGENHLFKRSVILVSWLLLQ